MDRMWSSGNNNGARIDTLGPILTIAEHITDINVTMAIFRGGTGWINRGTHK